MIKPVKYGCPKCGCKSCITGEIRTAGNILSRVLNIQNKRFTSVTCSECKFTEFYHLPSKRLSDVLDLPDKTDKLH